MGVYGSKDTGNLYTSEKNRRRNKGKGGNGGFGILVLICIGIFVFLNLNGIIPMDEDTLPLSLGNSDINNGIGARKNPAKIGEIIQTGAVDSNGYKCTIELELLDFKRGDEAVNIILSGGSDASNPGEGKEFSLVKFRVKNLKDVSGDDVPFNLSSIQFAYSTGDFVVSDLRWSVPGLNPAIEANLYEGAEHEGWICFSIEKEDMAPKVVFLNDIWFDL